MSDNTNDGDGVSVQKVLAARDLLQSAKQTLQVVDEQLAALEKGRLGLQLADDVSSEHRAAWFGVVDDGDLLTGVDLGLLNVAGNFGFQNPHRGTIRIQEDAAFVVTDVFAAIGLGASGLSVDANNLVHEVLEAEASRDDALLPFLRLTDANTGRNLVNGYTEGPLDRDRGALPFSYFSSIRRGLGSNVKNSVFAEFTLPRAAAVRVEVFNLGSNLAGSANVTGRAFVTLFGYKVFGG